MLAFSRFISKVWRDFQKLQIDTLRLTCRPEHWITHNFMGWFDGFDHYEVAQDLDLASWDWYVGTGHNNYLNSGAVHDLTRGLKRRNFWVMETQPGNVNWSEINNALNKGEGRCMAWHAAAHGADAILYWQWRSALGGQEQLHGTLLGVDGNPRPFYSEVQQIGQDFQAVGNALEGTTPQNEVAFLHSYDARWSLKWQRHHKEFDPVAHFLHYYRPLIARNVGMDVISAEAVLDGYKLVIAPALVVLSETTVRNLMAFVEGGGTSVLTVRCGQKDNYNALFPALQPGPLRELAGMEIEEFYPLDSPVPLTASWPGEQAGESRIWAERLRPLGEEIEVLARFGPSNGWLDGGIAVARHKVGSNGGQVIYVGAVLDDALQSSLTDWLINAAQVTPVFSGAPAGVEVARRVDADGRAVLLVLNHNREEATLTLSASARDLLTGETFATDLPLPPYGVRILA